MEKKKLFAYKLTFITITLSKTQQHSDNYIRKFMFEKLLRTLRRKYKMQNYIWRAETQANGNIHFHITADCFIHHTKLRNEWNKIQSKHNYIDEINNPNPNSTDIHSIKNIRNLGAYLCKYMSKNTRHKTYNTLIQHQDNTHIYKNELYIKENTEKGMFECYRNIKCKLWDASNKLKTFRVIYNEDDNNNEFYSIYRNMNESNLLFDTDHVKIFSPSVIPDDIMKGYNEALKKLGTYNSDVYLDIEL